MLLLCPAAAGQHKDAGEEAAAEGWKAQVGEEQR